MRAQKARNSRSGSASRRRRSACRSGSTRSGGKVLDPPGLGEFVNVSGDLVDDRLHPRYVDLHDGPVGPVGGRAQVDRPRVAAPVELPEPAGVPVTTNLSAPLRRPVS